MIFVCPSQVKLSVPGAGAPQKTAVTGTAAGSSVDSSRTQVEGNFNSNSTLTSLVNEIIATSRTIEEAASGVANSSNGAASGVSKEIAAPVLPPPPAAAVAQNIRTVPSNAKEVTSVEGGAVKNGDIATEAIAPAAATKPSSTVVQIVDTERRVVLRPIVPFSLPPPSSDHLSSRGNNIITSLPSASMVLEQAEKPLKKLLKVLHVCARYERCTGKPLPESIDFFGKTLLGMTSIR